MALVRADLAKAAAWARTHGRPLYLGEFGVNSTADMAARARWLACVAYTAEELGMRWACWQYNGAFGIVDGDERKWQQPLFDALVPPARSNPLSAPPVCTQAPSVAETHDAALSTKASIA